MNVPSRVSCVCVDRVASKDIRLFYQVGYDQNSYTLLYVHHTETYGRGLSSVKRMVGPVPDVVLRGGRK